MADNMEQVSDRIRQGWSADVKTRSGTAVSIRPIEPTDRALIKDFFARVSSDDLRFRFLSPLREVDEPRIDALCTIDPPRSISFLAFSEGKLAAVGTLAGDPELRRAEIALSTLPEWKRHGISWALFDHVIRFARAQNYQEIISLEKAENRAAIRMEKEMGFEVSPVDDDSSEMIASRPNLSG